MCLTINTGESIDHFVTRVRKHGIKCEFTAVELHGRIMELVIGSTPYDDFRKELLGQLNTYTILHLLADGQKNEAIAEGNPQLQKL